MIVVETDEMEGVLADVDADRGDDISAGSCAWHGGFSQPHTKLHEARARRVHPIIGRLEKQTSTDASNLPV